VPNTLCPKNKKNFSKNFLLSFALQKKGKKNKAFIYKASTSMTKLCSFCLRQSLPMAKKKQRTLAFRKKKQRFFVLPFQAELFFLPTFQNEESKKQTNEVRSFFSFCQDCPKSTSL
jgi:hypothetical protein